MTSRSMLLAARLLFRLGLATRHHDLTDWAWNWKHDLLGHRDQSHHGW